MRKILFAGTGEIAVATFKAMAEKGLVKAVLTAPDAPGKRGKTLIPSPVKTAALGYGLPVYQPEHLGSAFRSEIVPEGCDTLVSFCYGKIFGPKFLALFEKGAFNIHPSLLPRYRGCAPIESALLNGDDESGITIQRLALECDAGDVVEVKKFSIDKSDNCVTLYEKVASLAASFAPEVFLRDEIVSRPQQGEVSYSPLIRKEDAAIDFSLSSSRIAGMIRAYYPWPKAVCVSKDMPLFLCSVSDWNDEEESAGEPGAVLAYDRKKGFKVAAGKGVFYVNRLQYATKKELDAASFKNGNPGFETSLLGSVEK
jgi:methionyl-tRNA formyltransferase